MFYLKKFRCLNLKTKIRMFGVKVNIYLRNDTFILDLFFLLPLPLFPFSVSLFIPRPSDPWKNIFKLIQAPLVTLRHFDEDGDLRATKFVFSRRMSAMENKGAEVDERYSPCEASPRKSKLQAAGSYVPLYMLLVCENLRDRHRARRLCVSGPTVFVNGTAP